MGFWAGHLHSGLPQELLQLHCSICLPWVAATQDPSHRPRSVGQVWAQEALEGRHHKVFLQILCSQELVEAPKPPGPRGLPHLGARKGSPWVPWVICKQALVIPSSHKQLVTALHRRQYGHVPFIGAGGQPSGPQGAVEVSNAAEVPVACLAASSKTCMVLQ